MAKIRTFLDSGILIAASRGTDELAEKALSIIGDPARALVASEFVRLEVLPKAKFHKQVDEAAFYEKFFGSLARSCVVGISKGLVNDAYDAAIKYGLSAIDALHVSAAKRAKCQELWTAEKPESRFFAWRGWSFDQFGRVVRTIAGGIETRVNVAK